MWWWRKMLALTLLCMVGWASGLVWFIYAPLPTHTKGDGAVILTGGAGRLEAGFALLAEGQVKKILISGVYRGVDVAALMQRAKQQPDFDCCVQLGYDATDTVGNAAEAVRWASDQQLQRILVVTSDYHIRRALTELAMAWPAPSHGAVEWLAHPVYLPHIQRSLWLWPEEYNKYLFSRLRYGLFMLGLRL